MSWNAAGSAGDPWPPEGLVVGWDLGESYTDDNTDGDPWGSPSGGSTTGYWVYSAGVVKVKPFVPPEPRKKKKKPKQKLAPVRGRRRIEID